ncbi:MAG: 50S ribosome-binding GTPase [Acidilobaceae archaeon]|nr:50S ribosome-binding GTPase [Acidilobaceae archaeon]MCX8165540.1 50S ribosome-binding GTPase [Acidilobaceae archaeon]MDW7973967.1 GTPase [Sulfolobales archaeon]
MKEAKEIYIATYDEILERIRRRYSRGARSKIASLQMVHDILVSSTEGTEELKGLLRDLHPFYWRLIEIEFERAKIESSLRCVSKARYVVRKMWEKYRYLVMTLEGREGRRAYVEGRGRMMSLFRRCRQGMALLKNLVIFLQKLPEIEPNAPTLILAGPPNVGKSTFVSNVSSGRPEVANYPFTTKQVIVGHADHEGRKVQIIDTPGLLDRPVEEMNVIERRAVAALSELRGAVLFLIDPASTYMSLDRQIKVLEGTLDILRGRPLYVGINKIDLASEEQLREALERAEELKKRGVVDEVYLLSAISREHALRVMRDILSRVLPL